MSDDRGQINKGDQFGRTPLVRFLKQFQTPFKTTTIYVFIDSHCYYSLGNKCCFW